MMGFLRRLLGGGEGAGSDTGEADDARATEEAGTTDAGGAAADSVTGGLADPATLDEAERAHELELARQEAARLDELQQRQLRFADYAWTPPAQGGEQRADDEDRPADG